MMFWYQISGVLLGGAASPGCWGLMTSAAEHAHCKTTVESALFSSVLVDDFIKRRSQFQLPSPQIMVDYFDQD